MKLLVVMPVFNEQGNINSLTSRLFNVLDQIQCQCEIIIVDDGTSVILDPLRFDCLRVITCESQSGSCSDNLGWYGSVHR